MARAKTRKPKDIPTTPFPTDSGELHQQGDWLWIPLRSEWRDISAKPEEVVRQRFIRHLVDNYGYELSRMDQERQTMHGRRSPRADIVIWETPEVKAANKTSVLVIECKAESVNINIKDYYQGESYTRAVGCEFFIAHNHRYTAVFKLVPGLPGEFVQINELPKASDWGDAKRIEEIKNRLRAFNRKEFQDLLFDCHSILRDVHKMDPGRSFDTISKILFIKMYVERSGLYGTYTIDFLDRREATRMPNDPAYRNRCRARYGEAWEESHQRIINRAEARTNILDLFEIGQGKSNRATEIIFVERCPSLLKSGGRMGIVLPDGNLNNPSLAWLRRWCEGKVRILAIVSLPEETFRDATVKASLVFLRRFTENDETEWETAWTEAQALHDAAFDTKRNDLCADLGQGIVTGENENVAAILADLVGLGVERTMPSWSEGPSPGYPRGIGPTRLKNPRWKGTVTDKKRAAQLKKDYYAAFDEAAAARSDELSRELRTGLRSIDEAHNATLWATVREKFDYPVFVAAPKAVGITSTGETGETVPNDLPQILDAYRAFVNWVEEGAKPEDTPDFPLPSAA